jgi:histidinol-phosphate aminotransferase
MGYMYEKTATPRDGLRLHLNESTLGCSPAVVAALRRLTCEDVSFYPDYSEAISACCEYLGVAPDEVLLTNGLDEGILAISVAALRGAAASDPFEAIVVVPAFDMYAASADAAGGRIVEVPLREDFEFPFEELLAAVTPRTRIIYITDPNNPTGQSVPSDAVRRIAAAAPRCLVFVDEAYVEFRGDVEVSRALLNACPNVVIGRTFAKAHGLAAIRAGALVAAPAALDPIRQVVPPYSLNVAAAVALPAAIGDRQHLQRYVDEVRTSRELLYHALDRLGVRYWRSDGNFVLARFGRRSGDIVRALLERRIYVRDRSRAHGCEGCVRITTGVVEHTRRAIAALEEVLCAAR